MMNNVLGLALASALLPALALSQSSYHSPAACSQTLTAKYPAPSVAPGYVARLVANGLTKPRDIKFDTEGTLLVVEQGVGVTALNITDNGNDCLTSSSKKAVIRDSTLNHGIEVCPYGSTLYASSSESVYAWDYSPATSSNTSAPRVLVTNMSNTDHTTRTLLLSKKVPGTLVVTRGSASNLDDEASVLDSGHSEVRAFNLYNATGTYTFLDGKLLGWGLRNDVGIDEEPTTGGIYTVENSADQLIRNGVDIHENNPGEELNFLGYLDGTYSANQGKNFGYPECYAAWNVSELPDFDGQVGTQFYINNLSSTNSDALCAERQAPRLTFQAHMAPLDILFNDDGTEAWVTFHGSWNRDAPVGYKLSLIEFSNGEPTAPSTSTTAAVDIVANQDNSACPQNCFRPVGLAFDKSGRLFMSSDTTGEIYVVIREDDKGDDNGADDCDSDFYSNCTTTSPTSSATPSPSNAPPPASTGSASEIASINTIVLLLSIFALFI